jgi:hypothetical protein
MTNYQITRRFGALFVLVCVLAATALALFSGAPVLLLLWAAFGVTVLSCLTVLLTPVLYKRDGVLFLVCALGGGVALGAAAPFPANVGIWLWIIVGIALATLGIVLGADRAQAKPVNRI